MLQESNFANKNRAIARRSLIMIKDIIGSLETCDDDTNLTQKIGIYARQMPEFKILTEQRVACLSIVRQVCTGELSLEKSLEFFHTAEKQLNEALECIKL